MTRLRRNDGFTLPEVLVAMTVGFIVLAATLGLLESTVRLAFGMVAKTDSMQRGRLAMDNITQQLRSQVCLDLDTPAIVAGDGSQVTANSVTLYVDFSSADGTRPPIKRKLEFPTTPFGSGNIHAFTYTTTDLTPVPGDFTTSPTSAGVVLENVVRQRKPPPNSAQEEPFLRYYAFQPVGNPPHPEPTLELTPPLDAAEAARVARIDVKFLARPTGSNDNSKGVNISDQVMVRHADPNLSVPDPACT
jgi:prepilin-type N-terminal cleavage/methylation domain-containing protein